MPQQINLYNPILLARKRYFSALAMGQALAVLLLGLAALGGWSVLATRQLRLDLASATAADAQEKQRLDAALARRPALPKDTTALEQQLAQAQQQLGERQRLLAELVPGIGAAAAQRSGTLQLLAQTVPSTVWLTEVRLADGRVELAGLTLEPEALRPWLAALSSQPALAGLALRTVKVERREPGDGASAGASVGSEAWRFRVVSGRAAAGERS